MPVASSVDGKTVTISISGRFSIDCETDFRRAYEVGNQDNSYVVHLGDAKYYDNADVFLSTMLLLREHAGGDQADIIITDPPDEVVSVLEFARFRVLYGGSAAL